MLSLSLLALYTLLLVADVGPIDDPQNVINESKANSSHCRKIIVLIISIRRSYYTSADHD